MSRRPGGDARQRNPRGDFFDNTEDLRRRKKDEQQKIKQHGYDKDEEWTDVITRKQKKENAVWRQKAKDRVRETTFFISNLPTSCDTDQLWEVFSKYKNLTDAYVPKKKDAAGNRFGFIRLRDVCYKHDWILELSKNVIDGAIIGVNVAKFGKDGSRNNQGVRAEENVLTTKKGEDLNKARGGDMKCDMSRASGDLNAGPYKDILMGKKPRTQEEEPIVIDNAQLLPARQWTSSSLVGDLLDLEKLNNLKLDRWLAEMGGGEVKYLGGLKVFLAFNNVLQATSFLNNKKSFWKVWCSSLVLWEEQVLEFQRIAWVTIRGVPANLWDASTFSSIGNNLGKVIHLPEISCFDSSLDVVKLGILVYHGNKISKKMEVSWEDKKVAIWVHEVEEPWSPEFLCPSVSGESPTGSNREVEETSEGNQKSPAVSHMHGDLAKEN
ncbi:putative RNA recognition motif domain, nucleotide-binding alpha-beta plait domain superfamily [Helianthus annuus]|nr:putative RNA recognition motif domain, nucleotide-binding alpha-beta plait domain superfamily [Helianthus annuus]